MPRPESTRATATPPPLSYIDLRYITTASNLLGLRLILQIYQYAFFMYRN